MRVSKKAAISITAAMSIVLLGEAGAQTAMAVSSSDSGIVRDLNGRTISHFNGVPLSADLQKQLSNSLDQSIKDPAKRGLAAQLISEIQRDEHGDERSFDDILRDAKENVDKIKSGAKAVSDPEIKLDSGTAYVHPAVTAALEAAQFRGELKDIWKSSVGDFSNYMKNVQTFFDGFLSDGILGGLDKLADAEYAELGDMKDLVHGLKTGDMNAIIKAAVHLVLDLVDRIGSHVSGISGTIIKAVALLVKVIYEAVFGGTQAQVPPIVDQIRKVRNDQYGGMSHRMILDIVEKGFKDAWQEIQHDLAYAEAQAEALLDATYAAQDSWVRTTKTFNEVAATKSQFRKELAATLEKAKSKFFAESLTFTADELNKNQDAFAAYSDSFMDVNKEKLVASIKEVECVQAAGGNTGTSFPFYDNCMKGANGGLKSFDAYKAQMHNDAPLQIDKAVINNIIHSPGPSYNPFNVMQINTSVPGR